MIRSRHLTLVAAWLLCIAAAALALNVQAEIALVSQSSEGEQAQDYSTFPSISDDGRFIAFISGADNLVPQDTNGKPDTFVHDRETRETTRVSVASDGTEGNEGVWWAIKSLSSDGRFVVFSSDSDNLVDGDNNESHDIFLHDRENGETTRVSITSTGAEANRGSYYPGIFGNGRYVTFESGADNLVTGDNNGISDVFLHDRETGLTRRVNLASDGSEAEANLHWHSWIWWYTNPVTDDGRYAAFTSWSGNLVPGDDNALEDVFVHDLETGETERVSLDVEGRPFKNYSSLLLDMSDDGRFVAFLTLYRPDAPVDEQESGGLYIRDREVEKTILIPNGHWASFSNDGRYLAYSHSTVNEYPPGESGINILDMQSGEALESLVSYLGTTSPGVHGGFAAISGDGRSLGFASSAAHLVPGDANSSPDVFVTDNPHFFRINAGLNDAWYDPQIPGQGFHVTVLPLQQKMFVSWMTYDTSSHGHSDSSPLGGRGQRWLTAFGPYKERKAVLDVSSTMGGLFDSEEPAPSTYSDGTMTLEFTHCTKGTITYDFSSIDRRGVIPVQRVALDNVPLCELLNDFE